MNLTFQLAAGIIIAAATIELFRSGVRTLSEDSEFERGKTSPAWMLVGLAVLIGICVIWMAATEPFSN
jgi:hypothetical protein